MKALSTRLIVAGLLMMVLVLFFGCDGDDGPAGPSEGYSYYLILTGTDDPGGIFFSIADPGEAIDSSSIEIDLPRDVSSVIAYDSKDSRFRWEFLLLKKHGALERGTLGVITTESPLKSDFTIREVCDTLGNLLNPADFQLKLQAIN